MNRVLALLVIVAAAAHLHGQSDPVARAWNEPVPPFRIAENLYYVGAADVTSFLLTSPAGHILLDGGLEETAPQILRNIETLGFRPEDVRLLLNSHAHYDHAGGLAQLKRATGARLAASAADIPLLARGGTDDPQFGDRFPFPPVYADTIVDDRERLSIGNVTMTAHLTPGHTRGCTTWETTLGTGARRLNVVFLCSSSVPSEYRLVNNKLYPDAADDYRRNFRRLRSLSPDIFVAAHGSLFGLAEKRKRAAESASANPFIDPDGYRRIVEASERRFEKVLAEQQASPGH